MTFEIKRASKQKAKIKMLISGPSGSGKTYSALLMASGMTDWNKICVIDTERGSADLYSHLGPYNTLTLDPPYKPETYIEAINAVINAGMEVIIIDSITHEWDGLGGVLQIHESMTGNSFTNWAKLTPRHNAFINAIIQSPVHMICTGRSKQDYVLTEKNGKQVPEKVGMKAITREGFDYEVTLSLDLDIKHNATATKDRTGLFIDKPQFVITPETGKKIINWCSEGIDTISKFEQFKKEIANCKDEKNLLNIQQRIIEAKDNMPEYQVADLRKIYGEKSKQLIKLAEKKQTPVNTPPAAKEETFKNESKNQNPPGFINNNMPEPTEEDVKDSQEEMPFPEAKTEPAAETKTDYPAMIENANSIMILQKIYETMKKKEDYYKLTQFEKDVIEQIYDEKLKALAGKKKENNKNQDVEIYKKRLSESITLEQLKDVYNEIIKEAGFMLMTDVEKNSVIETYRDLFVQYQPKTKKNKK